MFELMEMGIISYFDMGKIAVGYEQQNYHTIGQPLTKLG